jgi:hypothetical protein
MRLQLHPGCVEWSVLILLNQKNQTGSMYVFNSLKQRDLCDHSESPYRE